MADLLDDPKLKLERAKSHLDDLRNVVNDFNKSEPYVIVENVDPHNGKTLIKAKFVRHVPTHAKTIGGDVISNLRSSLDQLACALAEKNGQPVSGVYFPMAASAADFSAKNTQEKIKKLDIAAITYINSLQPYKGGTSENLWQIGQLENTNKHRRFVAFGQANQKLLFTNGVITGGPQGGNLQFHGGKWDPIDKSVALYTRDPGVTTTCDMTVSFNIAFAEGVGLEGKPIIPFFEEAANQIENIIFDCENKFF